MSRADREAVFRFRYSVYVEELGRYRSTADHKRRLLVEPEDDHSVLYAARDDMGVVGTMRATFGSDGFSPRQVDQYRLAPFLAEVPAGLMAIGERLMVASHLRGGAVAAELRLLMGADLENHGTRIVFGDCEPHLLSLNLSMGCMTYADRNISSPEAGYLIPLVSLVGGTDGLAQACGGPAEKALPKVLEELLAGHSSSVISPTTLGPERYWESVQERLAELQSSDLHAFADMSAEEIQRCVDRSNVLRCSSGDRLLKKEGSSHNLFVVLGGTLEVRDGTTLVGVLATGDVFGEMAFLLGLPRQRDVIAVTDDVEILSLSEGTLRKLIDAEPLVTAKLLLNISKMLCVRLIRAGSGPASS